MSRPQVEDTDIIDLTGEPDTPPRSRSSPHRVQSGRGGRESQLAAQEVIDVDELEEQQENVEGNLYDTSPDVELVSVRPRLPSAIPPARRGTDFHTNHTPPIVPERGLVGNAIRALSQQFVGLQGFLPMGRGGTGRRSYVPHFLMDPQNHRLLEFDDDEGISPHDFRMPNPDFETAAFQIGQEAVQPAVPAYNVPPPSKEGFTRSPAEDSMLVCPNCDNELGASEDELKRQVWAVRSCGHVGHNFLPSKSWSLITVPGLLRSVCKAQNEEESEPAH